MMLKPELKELPIYITILSPIIIVVGIYTSMIYYGYFDIAIIDYIDLGEAVLLFLKYLAPSLGAFLIGYLSGYIQIFDTSINTLEKAAVQISPTKKRNSKAKGFSFFGLVILLFAVPVNFKDLGEEGVVFVMVLRFLATLIFIYLYAGRSFFSPLNDNIVKILSIAYLVIFFSADSRTLLSYYRKPKEFFLKTDHSRITTGQDTIFLGKTKSHYFFYSKANRGNFIIKSDLIESSGDLK
jgi:hypothetical protein